MANSLTIFWLVEDPEFKLQLDVNEVLIAS